MSRSEMQNSMKIAGQNFRNQGPGFSESLPFIPMKLTSPQILRSFFRSCALGLLVVGTSVHAATLTAVTTANWNTATSWNPAAVPNGVGVVVEKTTSGNVTLTQDVAGGVTVGTITNNATGNANLTINPTNPITLNQDGAGAGSASLNNNLNGRLVLGTGTLVLADNLNVTNSGGNTNVGGSIAISSVLSGAGNITFSNVSNSVTAGQIAINLAPGLASTFSGTVTVAKGAVTFNSGTSFSNLASNLLILGSAGQGSATLMSTASVGTVNNNIAVAAGSGGVLLLGANITGSMIWGGSVTLNGNVNLTSASTGNNAASYTNVISGTGAVTVSGTGVTRFSGTNTFTGVTRIESGTLQVGGNVFNDANTLALQNSTLDLNASDSGTLMFGHNGNLQIAAATLGGLAGARNLALTSYSGSSVALTVGNNNSSTAYSGTLTGGGSLIKVGSGTLTLSGAQTYTGTTAVTVGTLVVNGSLGNGGTSVAAGATLAGNMTIGGTTSVSGTLAVGNSPGVGNFGTLNLDSTATTEIQFLSGAVPANRGTNFDAINVSTALDYDGLLKLDFAGAITTGQTFDIFDFGVLTPTGSFTAISLYSNNVLVGSLANNSGVWSGMLDLGFGSGDQGFVFTQSTGDLLVTVPEPSTAVLSGLGLAMGLWAFRRRKIS